MNTTSTIMVRKHKGRAGKSVYEWRVYRVITTGIDGARTIKTQLGKYRTEQAAELAASHCRKYAIRKEVSR
jgi:PII-like signaling protein